MDHSENEDYTMSSPLPGKKSDKREDSDLSELEKPRSRKKAPVTDPEEKLGMDDLTKLVQEQKPKGSQRGRKRGHAASESEEQQWPEEKRHKEELLGNEDEQNSPPKKGKRGRPPKPLGGTSKEEPPVKTSKKGNKKKPAPPIVDEDEEEERQIGNTEQKSKSKQHRMSKRAQQRAESPETSAVESTQSTPQKGRGRPSKTPSPSQPKKNIRVGRSKQVATKENDSSEEMDVLQASSPVSDDTTQEGAEEEDISAGNVRRRSSKRERR